MKYLSLIALLFSASIANDFYYEFGKKVEINSTIQKKNFSSSDDIQEYTTKDGINIKFKNEIIVKCKKDIECEDDIKNENLNNFFKISKGFYLIKLDVSQNIFEYSQKLYLKNNIEIAHPNFIKERIYK